MNNRKPKGIDNRAEDKQVWSAAKQWFNATTDGVVWHNLTEAERLAARDAYLEYGQYQE